MMSRATATATAHSGEGDLDSQVDKDKDDDKDKGRNGIILILGLLASAEIVYPCYDVRCTVAVMCDVTVQGCDPGTGRCVRVPR